MDWKLEIRKIDNGYVLKGKFGDSDLITEQNIEEKDGEFGGLESMEDLLYEVMEYFGYCGSDHDQERIRIVREVTSKDGDFHIRMCGEEFDVKQREEKK